MSYYWVTAQAEYSTDIVFKSQHQLEELVPRLLEHGTLHFSARDILTFLGRKPHGNFEGEVLTDQVNPLTQGRLARPDSQLFAALMSGEHTLQRACLRYL